MGGLLRQILGTGRAAILPAAFLCAAAIPAAAQGITIDHAHQYAACMKLARATPEDGFEHAIAWSAQGGGQAARHCAAVALVGLGQYEEAALRLDRLAQEATAASAKLRPELLAQSGQAWLMAGHYMRAHAAQSAALKLEPDNVELLIDRSITLASAANYWEAVDDLNQALDLAPERADVRILRASAYRYLDAIPLAQEDIDLALARDPGNPFGLLERGILRRLAGDNAGARADWLRVLSLAPDGLAGNAARANLEKMDVKAE